MQPINNADLQRYAFQMSDSDIGISTGNAFGAGFSEGFEGTVTDLVGDSITKLVGSANETEFLSGSDVNEYYNLPDETRFQDDEQVPKYKAEMVGERSVQRRLNESEMELAKQTTSGTVAQFLGNLAGGMADPIGMPIGAGVGKLAMKAVPALSVLAQQAFKNRSIIQTFGAEAIENVIGAAIVDAPALMINRAMHEEDFRTDEYLMMVAGAGVLGGTIGTGIKMRQAKALRSTLGDNAQEIVDGINNARTYGKNKGIEIDETEILAVKNRELHTTRTHQTEYEFSEVLDTETALQKTYYGSYSDNTAKMYQDSSMGGGAMFFSDNPNLMENAVNSLDNMKKGSVVPINLNTQKIAGSAELDAIKINMIEKYPELENVLNDLDDVHDIIAHVSEVLNPGNIEKGKTIIDGAFVFNKAVLDSGFDGYTARGLNIMGENTHNGLVLLDKRAFGIKTDQKLVKFTGEGVKFDESIVSKGGEFRGMDIAEGDTVASDLNKQASESMERLVQGKQVPDNTPEPDPAKVKAAYDNGDSSYELDSKIEEIREYMNTSDLTPAQKDSLETSFKLIESPETADKFQELYKVCKFGG